MYPCTVIRSFSVVYSYGSNDRLALKLNTKNPPGYLKIISGPVLSGFPLPDLTFKLYPIKDIIHSTEFIDVCGIICHLTEEFRIKAYDKYYLLRWLHIYDDSKGEIVIKLFGNSQLSIFNSLAVGDALLLTQMCIKLDEHNMLWLESTSYTQIYQGFQLQNFSTHPTIARILDWCPNSEVDRFKVPLEDYKLIPYNSVYMREVKSEEKNVILIDQVAIILDEIGYRERKQITVQGYIKDITFKKHPAYGAYPLGYYELIIENVNRETQLLTAIPCFPLFKQTILRTKRKLYTLPNIHNIFRHNQLPTFRCLNLLNLLSLTDWFKNDQTLTETLVLTRILSIVKDKIFAFDLDIFCPTRSNSDIELVTSKITPISQ